MLYINFPEWIKPEIIPGFFVRWYGLMYLLAFGTAYLLFQYQVKKDKLETSKEEVYDFFFWLILGLLIGARVFDTIVYDPTGFYRERPWMIFWPFYNGRFIGLQGMSYHGGVIGGTIAGVVFLKRKKRDVLVWADLLGASIPLGFTFGRLGNFINGELYGRVTTSSWGMIFPRAEKIPVSYTWVKDYAVELGMDITNQMAVNLPRHPSQLYEAFFEGIFLWLILWFIVKRLKPFKGAVISSYIFGFGFFRFFVEYFRQPDNGMDFPIMWGTPSPNYLLGSMFNFTTGQILCFIMMVVGLVMGLVFYLRDKKGKKLSNDS